MRKIFSSGFVFCLLSISVLAQRTTLHGTLIDSLSRQPVSNATISLLQKKDSSLISFTMSSVQGGFELRDIGPGAYQLMITHVGYQPEVQTIELRGNAGDMNFGVITLNDRSKSLAGITVINEIPPVTLLGDTVQYHAGAFKVQPNASVEELLKKLPGVNVDKDGNVKAQGEKVSRILVDGKEFFGNDPKLATKNLPADAIDKVQVYNKQTDQAQLTGFDDGNSEKTINLKLKQDQKKGGFGKLNAGMGTNSRYQGRVNVNSFKSARQLSVIGTANNTNAEGFSVMDILNFTGELGRMMKGGGGNININVSKEGDNGSLQALNVNNTGINTIWGGGLNYNNIFGTKTELTSNYFYNHHNPAIETDIERQYFLPGGSNFYTRHINSENRNDNHRLNLSADYQIDSFTSLKISPSFSYQKTSSNSAARYTTLASDDTKKNDGESNNSTGADGFNFRTDLLLRRKFKKKGRTFSIALQSTINSGDGTGSLHSINSFYEGPASMIRQDTINQQNINTNSLNGYTARIVYTEPLMRRSLLEFSLGKSRTSSIAEKNTRDFDSFTGKFEHLNAQLSNKYENSYDYNNAGIRIRKQTKTYNYSAGLLWQGATMDGKITGLQTDSTIRKTFNNILPNARFQYFFSKFRNLQLLYSSFTNQPAASQLQPVIDNTDPLNIKTGNPELKQEYAHQLQLNLFLVNPYTNRNFFSFLSVQQIQNRIVNYDLIDALGIKTTKPVNINGTFNFSGDVNWSFPVRGLKSTIGIGTNINYYNNKQFINAAENRIHTIALGPELKVDISAGEKLQISFIAGLSYNNSRYSLQSALNTSFFSQGYETEINWQLPASLFLFSGLNYTLNSQHAAGFNSRIARWNSAISRQVMRFNRGEIKLSVNDLLNDNVGISRTANQNYIEDSRTISLRRFFLLSFTYNLSKTGLNRENTGGGLRIITK